MLRFVTDFTSFLKLLEGPRVHALRRPQEVSRAEKMFKKFKPRDANKLSRIVKWLSHLFGCCQL